MRFVGDATTRVVPDRSGREPRPQRSRQLARGAVVARHDDRGCSGIAFGQRRNEEWPKRLRHECSTAVARQRVGLGIFVGMNEQAAEHLLLSLGRRAYRLLGLVRAPLHQALNFLWRFLKPTQHVRGDACGVGGRRATDADAHAHEVS